MHQLVVRIKILMEVGHEKDSAINSNFGGGYDDPHGALIFR